MTATALQHVMLPPGNGKSNPCIANGRIYKCAIGSTLLVVIVSDAATLEANGWVMIANAGAGTTAQRPLNAGSGDKYLDTTLGYVVVHEGSAWRSPATGAAV